MKFHFKRTALLLSIVGLLLVPITLAARSGSVVQGEVVSGALFLAQENIDIDGTVDGDLFCAGKNVTVTGTVTGDVICASQSLIITGTVDGNVRSAAQTIRIAGNVKRTVSIVAEDLVVEKGATIGTDLLMIGEEVDMNGSVGRNMDILGSKATIGGTVKKDVNADVENMFVSPGATVLGTLTYTSPEQGAISGSSTIGTTHWNKLETISGEKIASRFAHFGSIVWWKDFAVSALGLFLLGLIIHRFAHSVVTRTAPLLHVHAIKSLLVGLATLFLAPALTILLLASLIGMPLGFLSLALFFALFLTARIIVIIFVGNLISKRFFPSTNHTGMLGLVLAILATKLVIALPFIGPIVALLTFLCGLGALVLALWPTNKSSV